MLESRKLLRAEKALAEAYQAKFKLEIEVALLRDIARDARPHVPPDLQKRIDFTIGGVSDVAQH